MPIDYDSYFTTVGQSGFTVTFNFNFHFEVEECVRYTALSTPSTYLRQVTQSAVSTWTKMDQLFNRKQASKFLDDHLRLWLFQEDERLGYEAISLLADMDSRWDSVEIPRDVSIKHSHVFNDESLPPWIELLKNMVIMPADSTMTCTVCLEVMTGEGEPAAAMPCQHIFHEDCIKKWLIMSHYCSLCRFELTKQD
ncbi:uncharacterized protein LOC127258051 [Andrographis paniculata]|uniref:uncharacterized protein LOC127258051 n=1 Tax=Andrographis paniculata TaxID=175694 RepID=UPI0021E6FCFA|nr:uncharacterized protein LOC127258051 [Andrographis paniculata]